MAYVGSAPAACSATVSSEVVVVLPWVPATATTRRPAITAASAAERGSIRRPRRTASTNSGLSSRTAVETTTVSASPTCAASWPRWTRAPSSRSACRIGESLPSLPLTATPRASMIRAMPDSPAPPMPTKCTRPSRSAGQRARRGRGSSPCASCRAASSTIRASLSSASRGISAGRGRAHRAEPLGVGGQRRAPCRRPTRGQRRRRRPAGHRRRRRPGRALRACSPLPIGSGTKTAGQPDGGGLGHAVGAGPADHQVGGGVGEVHPVDEVERRRTGTPVGSGLGLTLRADHVQHLDAGVGRARAAAPETAWLSRRAPCEPPVTSSVGRSGVEPEERAGLGAQRGAVELGDHPADRQPDVLRLAAAGCPGSSPRPGWATRAPALLARPGRAFCSWTTSGSLRRRAAR